MARDERTYIQVHDGMPDHPKVDGLSDGAFRVLVTMWCWCSRHLTDGHVPAATWAKRGTAKARRELLAAGLVETTDAGVFMHDYDKHQRSASEVAEARESKRLAGVAGNHKRWHVARGITDPDCELCAIAGAIPMRSQNVSQSRRESSPTTATETEGTTTSPLRGEDAHTRARATRLPQSFTPSPEMITWATERAPHVDAELETEKFGNYWRAKSGREATKLDWPATWRNWMLNARPSPTKAANGQQIDWNAAMQRARAKENAS